jgi:hypothetical protein
MKKAIILTLLSIFAFAGYAKVWTVNNNANGLGQFNSLPTAITTAAQGDTLYVMGSPNSYGDITISKKLVIYGAGYAPTGTAYNFSTIIGNVQLDSINGFTLSGLKVIGVQFNYFSGDYSQPGSKVFIERCRPNGSISIYGNWIIKNCMINSNVSINNSANVIITNNIIYGYISSSNQNSVLITNNIFLSSYYSGLVTVSYATIANNIFWQTSSFNSDVLNNVFNKNINYHVSIVTSLPPASNSGSGNITNQDPKFVNLPASASSSYETSYDYSLQAGPAKNAGTDGKDLGIYGGSYPMPNLTGAPNIPQITSLDIQNSVVPKNATLNVNFKARKQK